MQTFLTPREEKKLLKHIEKWGVPYEKYVITYLPSTRISPSFLYFNTEKYQIRFDTDESSTGGIPNIVKRQFELRGENSYSLNKDEPHIRNAINKGYYCPCNNPSDLLFTYNTIFLIGFFIVVYLIFDQKIEAKLKVFLFTYSSLVFSFPIADYHLPVLIFIILFNGFEDEKSKLDNFLLLLVLIVLFPFPHLFLWTFPSYSNMLNVAIYFYVLFISLNKKRYKNLLI